METQRHGTERLRRVIDPQILLLEPWDIVLDHGVLRDWRNEPGFGQALHAAFELLHAGKAVRRAGPLLPNAVAGFDAVFLTGGGVNADELSTELTDLRYPVLFGDDVFAAEHGGFELLNKYGLSGWVADWGQSQLKLIAPGGRWTFPRDWTRLRMPGDVTPAQVPAQRRRLREFVALALGRAMADTGQHPAALVFATASLVSSDGTLGGNTYAGFENDRTLLIDALHMADLDDVPLLVLSDAELAAHSVRCDARLASFRKVLVITLGYGIGAALIHRH